MSKKKIKILLFKSSVTGTKWMIVNVRFSLYKKTQANSRTEWVLPIYYKNLINTEKVFSQQ